ncbi:hypothetical protein BDD14_5908 [Edaphobacter modestus]|uniref:Uncharacterized protein n=1 Tax=Edaphobacter modestus TaxID=388466 RepID=A0A4Q7YEJ7_9BACT|nr:hypothetical protein BDD14_5908 [Edaphobacter modestus]
MWRSAERIEKYGVNRPRHMDNAVKTDPTIIKDEVPNAQRSAALMTIVIATETRNTRSATPTIPGGNIENSLCTREG